MKHQQWFTSACATAVLCLGLSQASADTTNLLTRTTFESDIYDPDTGELITPAQRPPWNPYTYPYSWGFGDPAPDSIRSLDTWYLDPPDMTNTVLWFTFDNTYYDPVPSGGGYGLGFGGPQYWIDKDPSVLSTNRGDYILSFDARVDGLLTGKTGNVEAQTIFVVPDNTVLPEDANGDPDTVFQLNISFQPTAEWKHFVFNLSKAGFGSGTSQDMMAEFGTLVSEIRFGFNLHMPHENYGFDGDNAVFIDNLQLEVIHREDTPPLPSSENVIAEYNFDDQGAWYSYPYSWTENTPFASFTASHNAEGVGVDNSNGWAFQFDTTPFADARPAWAGGGSGFGGPFDPSHMNTPNLASYKVYFDARVQGLASDKSSTSGQLQFRLRAPDDTVAPADDNTDDDTFFQVDYDVTLRTNWQTFFFTLDQGNYSDAAFQRWTNYFALTSSLQPQFQTAGAAADFGNDADNMVVIDNFKFVRVVPSLSGLTIGQEGSQLVISWPAPPTGTAKLQSATSVNGPYTDVQGAGSPYTVPSTTGASQFFRTVFVP